MKTITTFPISKSCSMTLIGFKNPNFLLLFFNNAKIYPPPSRSLCRPEKGSMCRYSLVPRVETYCKTENRTAPQKLASSRGHWPTKTSAVHFSFSEKPRSGVSENVFHNLCIDGAKISAPIHV